MWSWMSYRRVSHPRSSNSRGRFGRGMDTASRLEPFKAAFCVVTGEERNVAVKWIHENPY